MREIFEMQSVINQNKNSFSRFNNAIPTTRTCIIKNVYPDTMKADIFIPDFSNVLFSISIASNVLSPNSYMGVVPEIGSEGIVMFGGTHKPLIIAITPITSNTYSLPPAVSGELLQANKNCQTRHMCDNTIMSRSTSSIITYSENKISTNCDLMESKSLHRHYSEDMIDNDTNYHSYSRETIRPAIRAKNAMPSDMTEQGIDLIVNDNDDSLELFRDMIDDITIFHNEVTLSSNQAPISICELRNKLYNIYELNNLSFDDFCIVKEEGMSKNEDGSFDTNTAYKVSLTEKNNTKSFFQFSKDGTIRVKCRDFIIDKEV